MRLYGGKELVDISQEELDFRDIDEGQEAKVYDYGSEVLNIYKDYCPKQRLSEDDAIRLSEMNTDRILLPRRIIYNDNLEFVGYTTKHINGVFKRNILKKNIKGFVDEVDLLYGDLKKLADINYNIADLTMKNIVYDGGLYFVDPGSFTQTGDYGDRFKYKVNTWTLNDFLLNDLFHMVMLTRGQRTEFNNNFDINDYIGDFIRCSMQEEENVRQYIKHMSKF